jgi:hypothetical protein
MSTLTPETPTVEPQPPENNDRHIETSSKKPNVLRRVIGGGAILIVLAGGAEVYHLATATGEKAKASHSVGPNKVKSGSKSKSAETGPSVSSLQFKAGQTTPALAQNIISEVNSWNFADSKNILAQWIENSDKNNTGGDAALQNFLTTETTQTAKTYSVAMFGPNYKSNSDVTPYISGETQENAEDLDAYMATTGAAVAAKGIQPYTRGYTIEHVVPVSPESQNATGRTFEIYVNEADNAAQDIALGANLKEDANSLSSSSSEQIFDVTTKVTGNTETITSISTSFQ